MKLEQLIQSKARAEIFRLLFGLQNGELHLRALERGSGLSAPTIQQELKKLMKLDLVKVRKETNRHYYKANVDHPLFIDIHNMVLKTSGLVDILKKALDHKDVKVAFVFGSIATNTDQAGSDVDLMVIGDADLRKVVGWLHEKEMEIGREINPHTMSIEEFKKRVDNKEHFLTSVLESPKLFVIGTEDDLKGLGK